MIVTRVHEQDNNANGYLVCMFQVVSRSTYKWYPTHGSHDNHKCSRNSFIDKSIIYVVSHLYRWYQLYKKVVLQVILNFKWSSNEESSLTFKSLRLSRGWLMLGHRGRSPTTIGIKVTRSYTWCLKSYTRGVHQKWWLKCQPSTPNARLCINKKHTFYGNWWM